MSLLGGSPGDLRDHLGTRDVLAFTGSAATAMHLRGRTQEAHSCLIAHASTNATKFALPDAGNDKPWRRFVDTALTAEAPSCFPGEEVALQDQKGYRVAGQSVVVLVR